jgi:hypothetical protein
MIFCISARAIPFPRQAGDGGTKYGHGPEDHQALVGCGMAAHEKAPGRQSNEQREFCEIRTQVHLMLQGRKLNCA